MVELHCLKKMLSLPFSKYTFETLRRSLPKASITLRVFPMRLLINKKHCWASRRERRPMNSAGCGEERQKRARERERCLTSYVTTFELDHILLQNPGPCSHIRLKHLWALREPKTAGGSVEPKTAGSVALQRLRQSLAATPAQRNTLDQYEKTEWEMFVHLRGGLEMTKPTQRTGRALQT